jgi:hypothetical protein
MNKIVYNACYGGFGLSALAYELYAELAGLKIYPEDIGCGVQMYWLSPPIGDKELDRHREKLYSSDLPRHDPILVNVIETLGKDANGMCADLKIYETESNQYRIEEYDGNETVVISYDDSWTYIK